MVVIATVVDAFCKFILFLLEVILYIPKLIGAILKPICIYVYRFLCWLGPSLLTFFMFLWHMFKTFLIGVYSLFVKLISMIAYPFVKGREIAAKKKFENKQRKLLDDA